MSRRRSDTTVSWGYLLTSTWRCRRGEKREATWAQTTATCCSQQGVSWQRNRHSPSSAPLVSCYPSAPWSSTCQAEQRGNSEVCASFRHWSRSCGETEAELEHEMTAATPSRQSRCVFFLPSGCKELKSRRYVNAVLSAWDHQLLVLHQWQQDRYLWQTEGNKSPSKTSQPSSFSQPSESPSPAQTSSLSQHSTPFQPCKPGPEPRSQEQILLP